MTNPVLAITPGEPAGIGPELLLKFHLAHPEFRLLAVADPGLLRQTATALALDVNVREWQGENEFPGGEINCLPVRLQQPARPGILDPGNSAYVLDTLRHAVRLVGEKRAAALVTGPVHKGVINARVVMMLAAPGLRVALVTTHLPLREVADALTPAKLEAVIRITHGALGRKFGIDRPRLQVLGLNPHAGEGGHLGREDAEIIAPVIERLRADGLDLAGPVPADTAFNPQHLERCDAVVAMYHDQGLPVLKHMGFGRSVNITLGLPFIRTSVDHGTALDLAGSGQADTGSLHEAVRLAREMALQEQAHN
jgi:4-hydroxythreonine-4-phosphate dehydrogenase